MNSRAPTRILTGLAVAGFLVRRLQADSAAGQLRPRSRRPRHCDKRQGRGKDSSDRTEGQGRRSKAGARHRRPAAQSKARLALRRRHRDTTSSVGRSRRGQGGDRGGAQRRYLARRRPAEDDRRSGRAASSWNGRSCAATRPRASSFDRYMAFIAENPSWPAIGMLRRRAEATLWSDRPRSRASVRAFFGKERPSTTQGQVRARARAAAARRPCRRAKPGARRLAQRQLLGRARKSGARRFQGLITTADHKARMDMRLYAEDAEGAMRSANRAGGNAPAIAKARIAVIKKAAQRQGTARRVPAEGARDVGIIFSRVQLLRRAEKAAEAAQLMLSIPHDHGQAIDADQWWMERRLVARKLLDLGDAKTAYRVARDAAVSEQGQLSRRAPVHRRLDRAALPQRSGDRACPFRQDRPGQQQSRSRSRAPAIGRAARPRRLGRKERGARRISRRRRATQPPITARSRARGSVTRTSSCALRRSLPPDRRESLGRLEVVRAIELLYAIDERDLIAGGAGRSRRAVDRRRGACRHRRGRRPPQGCARHAAARQGGARARACRSSTMPFRPSAFPSIAPSDRRSSRRRLRHRPPGKHLQSEDRFERARHGADAGHARRRHAMSPRSSARPTTRSGC